jgi:hypothetical protein
MVTAERLRGSTVGAMTTSAETGTVTLSLVLTGRLAEMLASNSGENFYDEQPDRFEVLAGDEARPPTDAVFRDGTMSWCDSMSDALLFSAYEEGCGHTVTLLGDLAEEWSAHVVVLSSRRVAGGG